MREHSGWWHVLLVLGGFACGDDQTSAGFVEKPPVPYERPSGMSDQCWSFCEPYVTCLEALSTSSEAREGCPIACSRIEPYTECAVEVERNLRCDGQYWQNECGVAPYSSDCIGDWWGEAVTCILASTTTCTEEAGKCSCTGTHPYLDAITVSCEEVAGGGGGSGEGGSGEGAGGGPAILGRVQCVCDYGQGPGSICFQDELACGIVGSCCMPQAQ